MFIRIKWSKQFIGGALLQCRCPKKPNQNLNNVFVFKLICLVWFRLVCLFVCLFALFTIKKHTFIICMTSRQVKQSHVMAATPFNWIWIWPDLTYGTVSQIMRQPWSPSIILLWCHENIHRTWMKTMFTESNKVCHTGCVSLLPTKPHHFQFHCTQISF